jgi:hypothetical protein
MLEKLQDYDSPGSLANRLRKRRIIHLKRLIESILRNRGQCRILDLGGEENYWKVIGGEFLANRNVEVVLLNISDMRPTFPGFSAVVGDACAVGMPSSSFDIVHSNSVIEHVGDWQRMRAFAGEVRRLAPSYFVQTPNFWFPFEPHFQVPLFHWLPFPIRVALVRRFALGFYSRRQNVDDAVRAVEGTNLLTAELFRSLFPEAAIRFEKVLGLTKSLMAIRE